MQELGSLNPDDEHGDLYDLKLKYLYLAITSRKSPPDSFPHDCKSLIILLFIIKVPIKISAVGYRPLTILVADSLNGLLIPCS